MTLMLFGIVLFFSAHAVPALGRLRSFLVNGLGALTYRVLFTIVSTAGVMAMIAAERGSASPALAPILPPGMSRPTLLAVMPFALILNVAPYVPGNLKSVLRHPQMIGVTLWASGHVLAATRMDSLLLFSSFGVYAMAYIFWSRRRDFKARFDRELLIFDALLVALGLAAFILAVIVHGYLGRPVVEPLDSVAPSKVHHGAAINLESSRMRS